MEAAFILPLFLLLMTGCAQAMEVYGQYMRQMVEAKEQAENLGMQPAVILAKQDWITIPRRISYRVPIPGGFTISSLCVGRVHAWTGRASDGQAGGTQERQMVFMSRTGRVYHTTSRCPSLSLQIEPVSSVQVSAKRNADGGRYHACERCVGSGEQAKTLYLTKQGTRYHNDASCSSLKRDIRLVPVHEAAGAGPCAHCGRMGETE